MPQLDMLSWLNQVLTTTLVMFLFYALLALVFLPNTSSIFKGRNKLVTFRQVNINFLLSYVFSVIISIFNDFSQLVLNNLILVVNYFVPMNTLVLKQDLESVCYNAVLVDISSLFTNLYIVNNLAGLLKIMEKQHIDTNYNYISQAVLKLYRVTSCYSVSCYCRLRQLTQPNVISYMLMEYSNFMMKFVYTKLILICSFKISKKYKNLYSEFWFPLSLLILSFLLFVVQEVNMEYISLQFQPSLVLLSGKCATSGMSPKAAVTNFKIGQQDNGNDCSSYDIDDDHAWPEGPEDLWDLLPAGGGNGGSNTVVSSIIKQPNVLKTENDDCHYHELSTGPSDTTSVGYYGKGLLHRILDLCGYTDKETQKALFDIKLEEFNIQCAETARLAYLEGVRVGEASALTKLNASNNICTCICNSVVITILTKLMFLFLFTFVCDYILSVIQYNYFYKDSN